MAETGKTVTTLSSHKTTLWQGVQFLEFFALLVKQNPTCRVHINTYLISDTNTGVLRDLYTALNSCACATILVGTTRHVSQRSVDIPLKALRKAYPRISFSVAYHDHRKIYYYQLGTTRRAWLGSQNLYDSRTKNLIVELAEGSVQELLDELPPCHRH